LILTLEGVTKIALNYQTKCMVGPILELEFVVETAGHPAFLFLDCILLSFSLINFPNLVRKFNGFIDL